MGYMDLYRTRRTENSGPYEKGPQIAKLISMQDFKELLLV